jgi:PAS domain S-box-containing protein
MRLPVRYSILISTLLVAVFLAVKIAVLLETVSSTRITRAIEFGSVVCFIPFFCLIIMDVVNYGKRVKAALVLREAEIGEMEQFIDTAAIVSRADANGKITYVNEKFTEVSGYSVKELLGKDHNIVNSGVHPPEFWQEMYNTTVKKRQIWSGIVTNRAKNGELYHVDSYIKAQFENDALVGFISIRQDLTELVNTTREIEHKNSYLEHAAKIIRHDMHSGINTYIPRGISSLERRLSHEDMQKLNIEAPLKMIKEGLRHTQKVYKGVFEFTNLVKKEVVLNRAEYDLREILVDYLTATAYRSQVHIEDLGQFPVNEPLFCTAIDNLIRNGLKYNDSPSKLIRIYRTGSFLYIEDNGRGLTREEFISLSKPYARKENQRESGTGLGLNISIAIIEEHGFRIYCDRLETNDGKSAGTKITIRLT